MCVKQNIPETVNPAQSVLRERLLTIRRNEEAAIAAEEAARASTAAKREKLSTVLSRRWPEIEAHLREVNRVAGQVFGDEAGVRYETKVSNDNSYVTLQVFLSRGSASLYREIILTESGARFDGVVLVHGQDRQPLLDAIDKLIVDFFNDHKKLPRRAF